MSPAWTSQYLGLPYIPGTGECAQRAAQVWRDRFGFEAPVRPAHGDLRRAQELIAEALGGGDWVRVARPREGDAVVMRKGALVCHLGVWVAPGLVLHCARATGTVLSAPEALPGEGFDLVGFWRWAGPMLAEERLAA